MAPLIPFSSFLLTKPSRGEVTHSRSMENFTSARFENSNRAIANNGPAGGQHEVTDCQPSATTAEPKQKALRSVGEAVPGSVQHKHTRLPRKRERHALRQWIKAGKPKCANCGKRHSGCDLERWRRLRKQKARKTKVTAQTSRLDPESPVQSLPLRKPRTFSDQGSPLQESWSSRAGALSLFQARANSDQAARQEAALSGDTNIDQAARQEAALRGDLKFDQAARQEAALRGRSDTSQAARQEAVLKGLTNLNQCFSQKQSWSRPVHDTAGALSLPKAQSGPIHGTAVASSLPEAQSRPIKHDTAVASSLPEAQSGSIHDAAVALSLPKAQSGSLSGTVVASSLPEVQSWLMKRDTAVDLSILKAQAESTDGRRVFTHEESFSASTPPSSSQPTWISAIIERCEAKRRDRQAFLCRNTAQPGCGFRNTAVDRYLHYVHNFGRGFRSSAVTAYLEALPWVRATTLFAIWASDTEAIRAAARASAAERLRLQSMPFLVFRFEVLGEDNHARVRDPIRAGFCSPTVTDYLWSIQMIAPPTVMFGLLAAKQRRRET